MFKEKQQIEIIKDSAFSVTMIIFPKRDNASITFFRGSLQELRRSHAMYSRR